MQRAVLILTTFLAVFACPAFAGTDSADTPPLIDCGNGVPGGVNCLVSKSDLKQAHELYVRGLKLQNHNRLPEAYALLERASHLAPHEAKYFSAREVLKAKLVYDHVERGNALQVENEPAQAAKEFRAALDVDPENDFARNRLLDVTREVFSPASSTPTLISDSGEIHLQPGKERSTFHFRGERRDLFTLLASAYGMTVQFDDAVKERQVRFDIDEADFYTALRLACRVSKAMWTSLSAKQFFIAEDTPENHRQYDRMSLWTFVVPPHSLPQEVNDLTTTMRNMFDLRFVSPGQNSNVIEVRAPQSIMEACTKLMAQLTSERPQVMLDVRVFLISHQVTRNMGVHIPYTFNLFNIPAAALAGLAGQNIQDLINQLIASGGINQAGNSALSGLLSQLRGQQNSIFSQPLATFGGGLTFMGLSLGQFAAALSVNESWARSLEHMTMRTLQGTDATFHLGTRFPVLNATYAPIFNSPQISQVLGNQSYIPPFPSISYEDLGLNFKAKPAVHGNGDVGLQLELQVRSLTGQSANGVPVISNREYKGSINLKDGEPAIVAGAVSSTDQRSLSGLPVLGAIPLLNRAATQNSMQKEDDELMIIITPHVLSNIERQTPEIWMSER